MSKGQIPGDEDVLKGAIDRIVARLGTEDAAELALLRAHIRRRVPFLKRSLFAAALLRAQLPVSSSPALRAGEQAGQRQGPRSGGQRPAAGRPGAEQRPSQRPPGGQRPAEERAQPATEGGRPPRGRFGRIAGAPPAPQKADTHGDGAFAQLFVSIGRNRRVFARDLTALFTESLSLGPGEIGGVRVFEKYSFVDIAPAKAEEAISKLSGTELKGRTITVNYAKKKEEKEGA